MGFNLEPLVWGSSLNPTAMPPCKISTDYTDFPFVLKSPSETVRIITVPQLLQGVLTSLSARKTISKNAHVLFSKKAECMKTTWFINKCTKYNYKRFVNEIFALLHPTTNRHGSILALAWLTHTYGMP